MIDNYKIGNRITLLRKEKELTGEKFAEMLGVSPQAVSKWENGKNLPETALLPAIAALLGTSIDSILVPQELVVLDARYSCGDSCIVVTDALNRSIEKNKLSFRAQCPIGGQSVEGPAVFVLTVKRDTRHKLRGKRRFAVHGKQNGADSQGQLNLSGARRHGA